ncbi:MAG: hypothetical protein U5L11_00990 [Arhodomonas sp.]|nr:hypothetical protein [Arhodomonas sp.]
MAGGSVFKQKDREQSLIHLMRVNMLKRMESSIHAFALTVERLLDGVRELKERLEKPRRHGYRVNGASRTSRLRTRRSIPTSSATRSRC